MVTFNLSAGAVFTLGAVAGAVFGVVTLAVIAMLVSKKK